jgi:hypothetical protein
MNGLGDLTDHERAEYEAAGAGDRAWFAARPRREFRLRQATPAERKALSRRRWVTHVLIRKVHEHCRLRHPVLWTIPGALPDNDAVLARLAAGAVFHGQWGCA